MAPHDTFPQRVWHIVASIPEGYVTTYGEVARLAGSPRAARQVGGVLKRLPEGSTLPWHRVVNRHGDISLTGPDLQRQRQALLAEGVQVSGSGHIDLQHYRWVYYRQKKAPIRGRSELTGRQELRSAGPEPASGRHECRPGLLPSARYR